MKKTSLVMGLAISFCLIFSGISLADGNKQEKKELKAKCPECKGFVEQIALKKAEGKALKDKIKGIREAAKKEKKEGKGDKDKKEKKGKKEGKGNKESKGKKGKGGGKNKEAKLEKMKKKNPELYAAITQKEDIKDAIKELKREFKSCEKICAGKTKKG